MDEKSLQVILMVILVAVMAALSPVVPYGFFSTTSRNILRI